MGKFLFLTTISTGYSMAMPKDQVESITDQGPQRHLKMTSGIGYQVSETFKEIIEQYEEKKSNSRSNTAK